MSLFLLFIQVAALAHSSNMRPSGWNRKPIAQPSNREAQKEETTLAESNEGGDGDKVSGGKLQYSC